ncbi:MAG: hypothetical protein VKI42_08390 [Synechococcaceae cyanobacterium]|nr:hypothetical protein [Synechococcaceae cyanobacterium]
MNPPFVSDDYAARDDLPAYLAYQEFLKENPAWRDLFGSNLVVIQVITASVDEPKVWFGDPLAASCFDAWYEDHWSPAHAPYGDLPQLERPSPESGQLPEPVQPPLPEESWSSDGAGSDVSRTAPLYLEFRRFLDQNPEWLTEKGGELGVGAITPSRNVASIWLGGSQEALAFDAWYELIHIPMLDRPVAPPSEDPIGSDPSSALPPSDACEPRLITVFRPSLNPIDDASVAPCVDPKPVVSGVTSSALEQAEGRSVRSLIDPKSAIAALTPVDAGVDLAPAEPRPLQAVRQLRTSIAESDPLLAPRKSIDRPDWLPLHLRD